MLTCLVELPEAVDSAFSVQGYWEMNGTQLAESANSVDRLSITKNFTETNPLMITIRFNPMLLSDAGTYSCSATVQPQDSTSNFISGTSMPVSNQRTIAVQGTNFSVIILISY